MIRRSYLAALIFAFGALGAYHAVSIVSRLSNIIAHNEALLDDAWSYGVWR